MASAHCRNKLTLIHIDLKVGTCSSSSELHPNKPSKVSRQSPSVSECTVAHFGSVFWGFQSVLGESVWGLWDGLGILNLKGNP